MFRDPWLLCLVIVNVILFANKNGFLESVTIYGMVFSIAHWSSRDDDVTLSYARYYWTYYGDYCQVYCVCISMQEEDIIEHTNYNIT